MEIRNVDIKLVKERIEELLREGAREIDLNITPPLSEGGIGTLRIKSSKEPKSPHYEKGKKLFTEYLSEMKTWQDITNDATRKKQKRISGPKKDKEPENKKESSFKELLGSKYIDFNKEKISF